MIDVRCIHGVKRDLQKCSQCELEKRLTSIEKDLQQINKDISAIMDSHASILDSIIELQEAHTAKSKKKKPVVE